MKRYILITILALQSLTMAAASVISYITVTGIDDPVAGAKPDRTAIAAYTNDPNKRNANIDVTNVKWTGKFDSNGCFIAGNEYKVTVTATIKSTSDRIYDRNLRTLTGICERTKISGQAAVVEKVSEKVALISRTYKLPKTKAAPAPTAQEVIDYVSLRGICTPYFGERPKYEAYTILKSTGAEDTRMEVTKFTWSGKLDKFGRFKAGEKYTAKAHIRIKDGVSAEFSARMRQSVGGSWKTHILNGTGIIESCTDRDMVIYSTFETKDLKLDGNSLGRTFYTPEDARKFQSHYGKTLIVNESSVYDEDARLEWQEYSRMVLDIDDDQKTERYLGIRGLFAAFSLREIWLSEKYSREDVLKVISSMENNPWNAEFWGNEKYVGFPWTPTSGYMLTGDSYLIVPEGSVPSGFRAGPYAVRTYRGDVYSALKQGSAKTDEWCHNHIYTSKLATADRVASYTGCEHPTRYYYSCKTCGKCEYNKDHTFIQKNAIAIHDDGKNIIAEKNFVGINTKGERVYHTSCIHCGKNGREMRMDDFKSSYTAEVKRAYQAEGLGYNDYIKNMTTSLDYLDKRVLDGIEYNTVGKFFIPEVLTVKISPQMVNDVNWAYLAGFADKKLLGQDYTAQVTQLQACSIAVFLAEFISDEAIKAEGYVEKALKAGIITRDRFSPDSPMARQEVASYLYRALQYVKTISPIRYTPYESRLSQYNDARQVSSEHLEAVIFMEALGLMRPLSGKALSPQTPCSIEDALTMAYRSRYADKLGWWIARTALDGKSKGGTFKVLNQSGDVSATITKYTSGEMFWVNEYHPSEALEHTGRLAIPERYTGQNVFVSSDNFIPVREL